MQTPPPHIAAAVVNVFWVLLFFASLEAAALTPIAAFKAPSLFFQRPSFLKRKQQKLFVALYAHHRKASPFADEYDAIYRTYSRDVTEHSLLHYAYEKEECQPNPHEYEYVYAPQWKVCLRSSIPLLSVEEVQTIRNAADAYWNADNTDDDDSQNNSRFTFQRKGNSELHLSELPKKVRRIVDDKLVNVIYPVIRDAFGAKSPLEDVGAPPVHRLCVYDSLVIRYDAEAAASEVEDRYHKKTSAVAMVGAGQPLHRDLGLISVNIALSAFEEEYQGGGTCFETLLMQQQGACKLDPVLRPLGPGHALIHPSGERHAGALTTEGVRYVMVIFVTAAAAAADLARNGVEHTTTSSIVSTMPRFEVCARAKSASRELSDPRKKARFHRIALRAVPEDGESWGYLGLSTLEIGAVDAAIHCLERAVELTPNDGRFFNNLGLALKQKLEKQVEDGNNTCMMVQKNDADSRIRSCFEHAVTLLVEATSKGCDVGTDLDAAALNLGLWFANRDLFREACEALSFVRGADGSYDTMDGEDGNEKNSVQNNARKLYSFCYNKKKVQ